jgi:choline dehydrogenase-like flavoprotein
VADFDAIVVGSGMSGGMSAKELTERGLKVLVLERGPAIIPERDYADQNNTAVLPMPLNSRTNIFG